MSIETYALSSQVARITKFVSHNWDTPRWSKFLALVMHFNFFWAVVSSVVAMLVTFALCGPIKLLPQQQQPIADDKIFEVFGGAPFVNSPHSPYCCIVGFLTFWLTLLCRYDLIHLIAFVFGFPVQGVGVFVDKACIDQVDAGRKERGISSLAAFLVRSDEMLVVYSDLYLRKLWTVYELATFLVVRPAEHLVMVPTELSKVAVLGSLCTTFFPVLWWAVGLPTVHSVIASDRIAGSRRWALHCQSIPLTLIMVVVFRHWSWSISRMVESAKGFRLSEARCFSETDRRIVNSSLARYMRD
ncbi:unnamed protein product, partial [Polarella glacialis]